MTSSRPSDPEVVEEETNRGSVRELEDISEGISRTGSIIDLGIEHKILSKKGAWISHDGNLIGQGREAAKQALAENDSLMKTITNAILEKVEVTVGDVLAQNQEEDTD